ncbi:conserved hypothetical protein [Caldicellulosiruptor hydrothermalis 108]|uniref:Phage XkdN-like protein n=1 Tax=Caldicellulosiruptor hydrothermalis (strain DSM 18901 / VKM B-2411 / 108) TaxID=632292 RepID=E4QE17_CALH1|nr:hypothetical protein [Caldicellulosiruptor hydrothermalis]ADQ06511.1 conserved hypothetical protein [Caldicellulosiruptor hydrothermalis 108]
MAEIEREELLANEETMLQDISGVLEAMQTIETYETFTVVRNGKKLFSFRVRGLGEDEVEDCRKKATKMVKDRRVGGLALPQEFDSAKFSSLLIYTATHPEDKAKLWDNKTLWEKAGEDILSGYQLIDKVLKRGEKDAVIELIEKLSGYEETLIDTIKNS